MKRISILGLEIDIRARNREEAPLSLSDLSTANDNTISYLRSLSQSELRSRASKVTVDDILDSENISHILDKHGIVIIPDFINGDLLGSVAAAGEKLTSIAEEFSQSGNKFQENDDFLIQKGASRVSGYDNLSKYGKPVVQIRDGQDSGMVDAFNIDHLFQEFSQIIRPAYEKTPVRDILGTGSHQLIARNLNLYINLGVTNTRGFHVDAYKKKLKSFIYLTDVLSLDDGPYTYVEGSHVDSPYRRINKTLSGYLPNRTETPVVALESIVPAIAHRGTLVISDQGGSHRGFPQKPGHSRMVAVMNYS